MRSTRLATSDISKTEPTEGSSATLKLNIHLYRSLPQTAFVQGGLVNQSQALDSKHLFAIDCSMKIYLCD